MASYKRTVGIQCLTLISKAFHSYLLEADLGRNRRVARVRPHQSKYRTSFFTA